MSNSAAVRALRRRFKFYFNTPLFNKYGKSLRDFLVVTSMALGALLLMLFVLVLFFDDSEVEKTEEGMLFHNFDRDPDDQHKFVWTEVYRKSDDFLFHADNPPVQEYVEKHAELATHFAIEIYGNVSNEVIEKINSLEILKAFHYNICWVY